MRSNLALLFALVLVGCRSEPSIETSEPSAPLENGLPASPPASDAELRERAIRALGQILRDPGSGEYSGLRSGSQGSTCGTVNLGRSGDAPGSRLFVIAPDGTAYLSTMSRVNVGDPLDTFVDAYLRWCASPEEMQAMRDDLANVAGAGELPSIAPLELPQDTPPEQVPGAPPTRWRNAPPATPPGPPEDDTSFVNAVRRGAR